MLIRPIVVFSLFSLPSRLSITRFYILFEQTIDIIESFAFSPGYIYIMKLQFDVALNSKSIIQFFSLPDIIYSCSEVATFTSKHSPHLEINRIKKSNILKL